VQPLDAEEGIQLFLDRARLVRPGMSLTIEDRSILEDIVTELDGLPLALELAAGRARMMSLRQLRDRLDRRFDLLRGSPTERRSKEATLRGALDWSWDLLKPWEREVWMQCTIFRGGFSCEAAEAVLDLRAHPDAPWVVDVLEELLEKSLLVIDEDPHEPRFRQLVSVREYGQERLPQLPGAERDALRRRHAEHYSRLGAETALEALHRQGGVALRQVRLSDLDNILQASRWGVDNSVGPVAARATLAAMDLIAHRGPVALSESLVDGALSLDFMPFPLAARLHLARAGARQVAGRLDEALADAAVAIELAQNNGLSKLEGRAVGLQGRVHQRAGRIEDAARCFMKALRVHRMEGDRRAEAERLSQRGMLNLYREDLEEALSDLEEALAIQRSQGNRVAEGSTLGNMATLHNARGDKARAQQLVEEALSIACEVGNRRVEAVLMNNLGLLLSGQGRPARVEELYQSSIDLAEAIGDTQQQGLAMGNLANHHVMEGQAESALRCYLRGLELDRRAGNRRGECVTLGNLGDFYLGRKELGPAHESLVRSLEIAESLGYQTAQGAFGATLALVAALQGDRDEAERGIAQSIERLVAAGNPGELFKARCIAVRIQSLFGAGPKDLESARSVLRGELEAMGEGVSGELRQALELANQESTGA
jgi:tetratricopeptide (TPR) repeat protein